ncbi:hypothetical protein [Andreprevotia chitinilytica]|uniref:hypothetical protein n=1 Tax=Andreprevotia chitinilytica TaxID=396808 RepID=UPI0005513DB3|nr:hypothetical protein [Andreprevotia chitinilytica]
MLDRHSPSTPPMLPLDDFNNVADIGLDRIAQLGGVFRSMIAMSEPESDLHHLAKVGAFLTEEWHFGLDTLRYETMQRLGALRPMDRR